MKLELKHLAPYLPYELKVTKKEWDKQCYKMGSCSYSYGKVSINYIISNELKPIFRPIYDITNQIDVNGEIFIPLEKLESMFGDCTKLTDTMLVGSFVPFGIVQKLFEWHFDVFNLIENDLAININSLSQSLE